MARTRLDLPEGLPPMSAGLFGALGYDMIRLAERLPNNNPDPFDLPDAIMIRPSIIAIFDSIAQEIIIATTVRPSAVSGETAYGAACRRLRKVVDDLAVPLARQGERVEPAPAPDPFVSPIGRDAYGLLVERAKEYIRAGDIFQVVPSHRFAAPFALNPFALYRSLRRTNPSPFLFYLNYPGFQLVGSSPRNPGAHAGRQDHHPPDRRNAAAGRHAGGGIVALEAELLADPKERAEHLMLLDLGRNDVGRVATLRQAGRNTPPLERRARQASG